MTKLQAGDWCKRKAGTGFLPSSQMFKVDRVDHWRPGSITLYGLPGDYDADLYVWACPIEGLRVPPPPVGEHDPNGLSLKVPGAKADAGKLRPTLIIRDMSRALLTISKIATDGAVKYSDGGWMQVPNGPERYEDADLRHMLKRFAGQEVDTDSGEAHLAHEAWNALAKLELYLRKKEIQV